MCLWGPRPHNSRRVPREDGMGADSHTPERPDHQVLKVFPELSLPLSLGAPGEDRRQFFHRASPLLLCVVVSKIKKRGQLHAVACPLHIPTHTISGSHPGRGGLETHTMGASLGETRPLCLSRRSAGEHRPGTTSESC